MRRLPPPPDTPAQRRLFAAPGMLDYLVPGLLYPLRGTAPFVIAFLGFGLWLWSHNVFAIFMLGVFTGATLHWVFHVLERSVLGYADPPALSAFGFLRWDPRPLKFLLLFALVLMLAERLQRATDGDVATLFLLAWVPLAPAVLVTFALEGSLRAALDPRRLVGFVVGGGLWYWLAVLGLAAAFAKFLAGFIAFFSLDLLPWFVSITVRPNTLGGLVLIYCGLYAVCAGLHLFGIALWMRREDLRIETPVLGVAEGAEEQARMVRNVNDLFARVDRMVDLEQHDAAERELLGFRLDSFDPLTQLELMFEAARTRKRAYLVCATGQRLIDALLQARRWREALDAVEICLDRYSHFEPFRPAQSVVLAREALAAGRAALFQRLVAGFDQRHPDALAERSEVAWLCARSHAEQGGDDAAALAVLDRAPQHPDPAVRSRIDAYRDALRRNLRTS